MAAAAEQTVRSAAVLDGEDAARKLLPRHTVICRGRPRGDGGEQRAALFVLPPAECRPISPQSPQPQPIEG